MPQSRRDFLSTSSLLAAAPLRIISSAPPTAERPSKDAVSLAAWSLNRSFFVGKKWKLLDLPRIARQEFDINALELVNQFFENPIQRYVNELRKNAQGQGVSFVLIMVDGEGDMAARDKSERLAAAICHRKWIDIGHSLGCHAIRCNLTGVSENWKQDKDLVKRGAESFSHLLDYARQAHMNVIIENHGGASNDVGVLVGLMKMVNDPNFGILPDFAHVNPGDDHVEVLRSFLPYAKGISVKGQWSTEGKPALDLAKLIKVCMDFGYHGYYGIESSYGRRRSSGEAVAVETTNPEEIWRNELQGVKLTKQVLERTLFNKT